MRRPLPLMSRAEVAELLGVAPEAVRSTLRRYGVREVRGYPREAVMASLRPYLERRAAAEGRESGSSSPARQRRLGGRCE